MSNTLLPEPQISKEKLQFIELFLRLIDTILNRIFDLRPEKAVRRMRYFVILLFASGFLISLYYYPLELWMQHIQDIIYYFLYPAYAAGYTGDPFTNLFFFGIRVFTDARVLQYLPVFLAAFFIALQSAAIYLADVFELDNVSVARSFIWEVALTGSDETMRISQGDILAEHQTSSNYLIGGPGKVIVDLDSVALFEKPDGTPRVIGPTGKEPGGKATLDGFERFRQALDLRDHFIELRDQGEKTSAVHSRSLDGIPITATDVRFMFSIYRDGQKPTTENPYPFSRRAVEQIVYKATSRVTPDLTNPSTFEFSWVNNMIGLIRGRLGGFMNEHKLTEYLASIGMAEYEKAKQQEEKISEEIQKLAPSVKDDLPIEKYIKLLPDFTPRYEIKNLFSQFAEDFTKGAKDRGVELHWIGIGIWKTDFEDVINKHLDAWMTSRENLIRGSSKAIQKLQLESEVQKMIAAIQTLPLAAYHEAIDKYTDRNHAMKELLLAYQRFFKEQLEPLQKRRLPERMSLIVADFYIGNQILHRLYPSPPEPESDKERVLYQNLLARIGMPQVIEKLIETESGVDPTASRIMLLERITREWDTYFEKDNDIPSHSEHWVRTVQSKDEESYSSETPETRQDRNRQRSIESSYQHLVQLVNGDNAIAERLITFERSLAPKASRRDLIGRAIERLLRDRK
jgi:hypothetical protein